MLVESMPSFPFEGVGAVLEYFSGIAARGYEQSTFHGLWVRVSGTTISSGLAVGHSLLMMLLHLWVGFDGTEVYYLTSAEEAARRLVMIERAVERSSPPPDFDGLEVYLINTFEGSAEVVTSDFSRHISDLTRTEAIIWGHYRMQMERQDQEARAASQSSGAGIDMNIGGGGAGAASLEQ
jgi:NADH:ubiquinone oxidoreductase subunit